ncbi:hypothetical protein ACJJTC_013593 [Scirpophaga incertulas]
MVQEHWGIKFKPKQGLRGLNSEKSGIFGHLGFSGGYPGSCPLPRRKPRLSATGISGVVAVLDTDLTGRPPYWRTLKAHNSRNTHPISTGLLNRVTAECPLSGKGVENQIGVKKF